MSRIRVALGLGSVAMGTAWATGGVEGLRAAADVLAVATPSFLLLAGVTLVLRAAVPRGRLGAPVTLMGMGFGVLAVRFDVPGLPDLSQQAPTALIMGGIFVALFRSRDGGAVDTGVMRFSSVLYPHVRRKLTGTAPRKLILRGLLFGAVDVDLSGTSFPPAQRLVVDVTVLWAQVDIKLPPDWTVLAGRIDMTSGVRFSGRLSQPEFAALLPPADERRTVVVNVQGLGGAVSLATGP